MDWWWMMNKKIMIWIIALILIAPSIYAGPDFYPADNINIEGVYNVTNASFVYATHFCFNNGTCFSFQDLDVVQVNSMWAVALMISIIGTAFLFVYISNQIGSSETTTKPILSIFYATMKLLLILGALIMPLIAIQSNQGIWDVDNLDTSRLDTYLTQAWRVALWIPIILVSLIAIFLFVDFIYEYIKKKKSDREIEE